MKKITASPEAWLALRRFRYEKLQKLNQEGKLAHLLDKPKERQ